MQGKDNKKKYTYDNRDPKFNFLHQKKQNQQNEYIIDNNGNRVNPAIEENEYKVTSRQSTVIIKKIAEDSAKAGQQSNFPITLTAIGYAVNHALQILQTYKSTNSIVDNKVEIKMSTLIMEFEAIPLVEGLKPFDYSTVNGKITIKMTLNIQNKEEIEKRLNSIHVSNRVQRKRAYNKNKKPGQGRNRGYNNRDNRNVNSNKNNNNNNNNYNNKKTQYRRVYRNKNEQHDNNKDGNQERRNNQSQQQQQPQQQHHHHHNNQQQQQSEHNNQHDGGNFQKQRRNIKNNEPKLKPQTRNNNRGNNRDKGNISNNNQNQTPQN